MFTNEIRNLTLASNIADILFNNITVSINGFDQSFAATMRAVFRKRLPAKESLNLSVLPLKYDVNSFLHKTPHIIMKEIAERVQQIDIAYSYSIFIVYQQDKLTGNRILDIIRSNIHQFFGTYTLQEDLRIFYIKMLDGLFCSNSRSAIIFLDYLDMRRFHALQMMIPRYLPGLFTDSPLSVDETALLKSLGLKTSDEYEHLIEQFSKHFDIRSEIIKTKLQGFEVSFEQARIKEITEKLEICRTEYQAYLDNLRKKINAMQELQIILSGLQSRVDSRNGESELTEYFLCNKNISIMRVHGTELEIIVHGYADVFDEQAFKIYVNNPNSYLYRNTKRSKEVMTRFYSAVFGGSYKLRLCAAYIVNMRNNITPIKNYVFPPESKTYIPNPHIQNHGCIGSFASKFAEYMHRRDYVGAIDQAAVSARNLNFHDSIVVFSFIHDLLNTTIKCVEDTNGNLMTPDEAIEKLEGDTVCPNQSG